MPQCQQQRFSKRKHLVLVLGTQETNKCLVQVHSPKNTKKHLHKQSMNLLCSAITSSNGHRPAASLQIHHDLGCKVSLETPKSKTMKHDKTKTRTHLLHHQDTLLREWNSQAPGRCQRRCDGWHGRGWRPHGGQRSSHDSRLKNEAQLFAFFRLSG